MKTKSPFRMPKAVKITGRSSSITNSFVNGIIPRIKPTEEQIIAALAVLGMDENNVACAYCGDAITEWDHLNPLVIDKQATGFISEIQNLVPSCGKCNQSKGNKNWKAWMLSDAPNSPTSKRIPDLQERIERLEEYERLFTPHKLDFEKIVGPELWKEHWANNEAIQEMMRESQRLSEKIRCLIAEKATGTKSSDQPQRHAVEQPKVTERITDPHLSKSSNPKVSDLVKSRIIPFLEQGKCSAAEIERLQDLDYCKRTFACSFPMLKKLESGQSASKASKDANGYGRYYVTPITIRNSRYLVSSQWYRKNYPLLERWLKNTGHNDY